MAQPEQIWNDNDLPGGDQTSRTHSSDEDTITYDRTESGGTAQQGLLCKTKTEDGKMELAGAGEKPHGVIRGSGGKGRVSVIRRGYNIKVPRGDTTTDSAVTVVNAQDLDDTDGSLTIANNLSEGQNPSALTVTPAGSPSLTTTTIPGTVTITGTDVNGAEIEETLSFPNTALTTAQTTDATFQTVTEVAVAGWGGGTVTIATAAIETITPGHTVVGDTKSGAKGYAKGAATGGLGSITRITPTDIYFDLP